TDFEFAQNRVCHRALIPKKLFETGEESWRNDVALELGEKVGSGFFAQYGSADGVCGHFRPIGVSNSRHDVASQTSEVLDQDQPKSDGDRPEFTDGQANNTLISVDKVLEALQIECAVAV